jgi:hypothetical protein
MKKIFLAVAALIITSLVVGIYFMQISGWNEPERIMPSRRSSFCSEMESDLIKSICLKVASGRVNACDDEVEYDKFCYDTLIETVDVSEDSCKSIKNKYGKFLCYKKLAVETENSDFCMNSPECYKELAVKYEDTKFCDKLIENEKLKCYAIVIDDRSYCEKIDEEFERRVCMALIPERIEDCTDSNYYDADCITKLANKTKNSTICNFLTGEDEMSRWKCLVVATDDLGVCDDAGDFFVDVCKIYYLRNHFREVLR